MKLTVFIFLIVTSMLLGVGTYAYFNEWIIIKNPLETYHTHNPLHQKKSRVPIKLFFWRHDQWEIENSTALMPEHIQEKALLIIQSWFNEAHQAGYIPNNSTLETVLFDPHYSCIYISLNAPLFDTNQSTQASLLILESLLKTVRLTFPQSIQFLQILIHHKIYTNPHIDCTQPFPINGFATIKK